MTEASLQILAEIKSIPNGRVCSYREIAQAAGLPNGARMVARILHTMSRSENLPWHRVVRSDGCIALKPGSGFELQKALLEAEGHVVSEKGFVRLSSSH
ncbi:hypothetical protein MASR2M78_10930 [Treponema sp.]